jgi:hypothetical protein
VTGPIITGDFAKNSREHVRVALDTYAGHDLIDIRVTAQLNNATGVWVPTKKGVSVNITLLPDLIAALQTAEVRARELGLIGGEA